MKKVLFVALAVLVLFVNGCARAPKHPIHPVVPFPAPVTGVYHTVVRGETLYRIAKFYHINLNELMRANRISAPGQLTIGQKLFVPAVVLIPPVVPVSAYTARIGDLVGPRNISSVWQTITVHHSGTRNGSARLFDKDHHRRHMGGLFYHFVIGNGTNSGDGEVEVGWRWKAQVKANRSYDIQICLVGNFDEQLPSEPQFNSLVVLINTLRAQYNIPLSNVRQHRDIRGKHTDCPGKIFPFSRLLSALARN